MITPFGVEIDLVLSGLMAQRENWASDFSPYFGTKIAERMGGVT